MSVQAPTTSSSIGGKYPPGIDELIFECLDEQELHILSQISKASRREIHDYYILQCRKSPLILEAYGAAANGKASHLARGAVSLVREIRSIIGGDKYIRTVTLGGTVSVYNRRCQHDLIQGLWHSRAVGLYPILQKFPESWLGLRFTFCHREKYLRMRKWIQTYPERVASLEVLEINAYECRDVGEFGFPRIWHHGNKVYNLVPEAIRFFTGLKSLSLNSNRLSQLPPEFNCLKLQRLSIKNNFLREMPPPLPTLRYLFLNENAYIFSAQKIGTFINEYIKNGGQCIEIFFDNRQWKICKNLASKMSSDTHEISITRKSDETILTVSKILELTQPLELP